MIKPSDTSIPARDRSEASAQKMGLKLTSNGRLKNPEEWTPEVAALLAAMDRLDLTPALGGP